MKKIVFTVTNDLNYDQRMMRICTSLASSGFSVLLAGVRRSSSTPLSERPYRQKRLECLFQQGFGFYAEYNIRLFFFLLFVEADIFCCIDLDTMLPVRLVSVFRNKKAVYDAHEYFSQQKEIVTRPGIYRVWHWIERNFVPKFKNGYTVCQSIADEFYRLYNVRYEVIRNLPLLKATSLPSPGENKVILYQGAVNVARGLEFLVPAMKKVEATLEIYGDGNFMAETKKLITKNNLQAKVLVKGKLLPEYLDKITSQAYIGLNLVENNGLNQYYSLANKFFDYIHSGIPQLTMDYPEYKRVNELYEVAVLIDDLSEETIAAALNTLLTDKVLHERLRQNCLRAREALNWQEEEKKLIHFYNQLV